MFGLQEKQATVSYAAIIDIGSGSVGISVIESDSNKKLPKTLFIHRVYMRAGSADDSAEDRMRKMREALFTATLALSRDGMQALRAYNKKARISKILVTCASPWGRTISRNVSYEHDTEQLKVTRELIDDLTESAEHEVESQINESQLLGSAGLEVVERVTIDVQLNGYPIQNPIGLTAKHISLSHVIGLVPNEILDAVQEVQEKVVTGTQLSVHTSMLVTYCVLRELFPDVNALTILDVTGEATEIGIIENSKLIYTSHIPHGSSTIVRHINSKLNDTNESAIALLKGYTENTLTDRERERVQNLIQPYEDELKKFVDRIEERFTLPKTMVVTALPQYGQLFRSRVPEIIQDVTKETYTVLDIQDGVLTIDAKDDMDAEDIYLIVAANFYHRLHGCGEIDG